MSATEPALQCSILEHMPREEDLGAGKMTQHLQNPSQVVAKCRSAGLTFFRATHTGTQTHAIFKKGQRAMCHAWPAVLGWNPWPRDLYCPGQCLWFSVIYQWSHKLGHRVSEARLQWPVWPR